MLAGKRVKLSDAVAQLELEPEGDLSSFLKVQKEARDSSLTDLLPKTKVAEHS